MAESSAHEDLVNRRRSLQQATTGAAMVGAGTGGRIALDRRLKANNAVNPLHAIYNSARSRPKGFRAGVHLPDLAGRSAARSLQAVGLPLAAYGAVNAVRAKPRKVRHVSGEELAHHVVRQAAYVPTVERGEELAQPLKKSTSPGQLAALRRVAALNPGTAERHFMVHDPRRQAYAAKRVRNAEWGSTKGRAPSVTEQRRGGVGNTRWALGGAGGVDASRAANPHAVAASSLRAQRSRRLLRTTGKPLPVEKLLTQSEQRKLDAHRRFGRTASLVGGTLGLSALALRAPSGASALARRVPSLAKPTAAMAARDSSRAAFSRKPQKRVLRALADTEEAATKHSNTLGIAAIGTGAAGSFNYAAQQKLERKNQAVAKFYRDPSTGQFTSRNMTAHEYDDESESLAIDVKNLFRSEGDHKAHMANRANLRAARAYYVHRGEDDLVDNLDRSMRESVKRHRDIRRGGPKKKIIGKRDDNRVATGSGIAGVGGVTAAVGLAGGGIPGVKAKRQLADVAAATTRRKKVVEATRAYRGGEFGYRTNAHHTYKVFGLQPEAAKHAGDTRSSAYHAGKTAGLISSEDKIIPHLKRIRRASNVALLGGAAAVGYGVHRARTPAKVTKADKRGDATNATLVGTGLTTAGVAHFGAKGMERKGRKFAHLAETEHAEAQRLVPQTGGSIRAPHDPKKAPNPAVPNVRPARNDAWIRNEGLKGRSNAHAHAVGALRGSAHNHAYFGNTYGGGALIARKVRGPALTAAAIGGVGLVAARRHEIKNKVGQQLSKRDDRFIRGYRERISPQAEGGYRHLKSMRTTQRQQAAGGAAMTGLGAWLTRHEIKHKSGKAPAVIAGVGTLASGMGTLNALQNEARLTRKIEPIKAKARSRRAQGLYGPGRGLDPVDMTSARAKALSKALEAPMDARATNLAQAYTVNKGFGGKLLRRAAKPAVQAAAKPQTYVSRASRPLNPNSVEARGQAAHAAHQDASMARLDRANAERKYQEANPRKLEDHTNYQPYVGSYGLRPR